MRTEQDTCSKGCADQNGEWDALYCEDGIMTTHRWYEIAIEGDELSTTERERGWELNESGEPVYNPNKKPEPPPEWVSPGVQVYRHEKEPKVVDPYDERKRLREEELAVLYPGLKGGVDRYLELFDNPRLLRDEEIAEGWHNCPHAGELIHTSWPQFCKCRCRQPFGILDEAPLPYWEMSTEQYKVPIEIKELDEFLNETTKEILAKRTRNVLMLGWPNGWAAKFVGTRSGGKVSVKGKRYNKTHLMQIEHCHAIKADALSKGLLSVADEAEATIADIGEDYTRSTWLLSRRAMFEYFQGMGFDWKTAFNMAEHIYGTAGLTPEQEQWMEEDIEQARVQKLSRKRAEQQELLDKRAALYKKKYPHFKESYDRMVEYQSIKDRMAKKRYKSKEERRKDIQDRWDRRIEGRRMKSIADAVEKAQAAAPPGRLDDLVAKAEENNRLLGRQVLFGDLFQSKLESILLEFDKRPSTHGGTELNEVHEEAEVKDLFVRRIPELDEPVILDPGHYATFGEDKADREGLAEIRWSNTVTVSDGGEPDLYRMRERLKDYLLYEKLPIPIFNVDLTKQKVTGVFLEENTTIDNSVINRMILHRHDLAIQPSPIQTKLEEIFQCYLATV